MDVISFPTDGSETVTPHPTIVSPTETVTARPSIFFSKQITKFVSFI